MAATAAQLASAQQHGVQVEHGKHALPAPTVYCLCVHHAGFLADWARVHAAGERAASKEWPHQAHRL